MQSLLADQGPGGDPRVHPGLDRQHRQPAAAARHLPRLPGADRAQPARGPRARDGALGHAVARLRAQGQEDRPGRHQRPQREVAALAALARRRRAAAWCRSPASRRTRCCRTARGRRSGSPSTRAGRWPSSPASGRPLDLGAEGQGGRDHERPLRLPHDRAERGGGCHPPQGHAGDPDHAGGDRGVDDGTGRGGAAAAAAACRMVRSRSWRGARSRTAASRSSRKPAGPSARPRFTVSGSASYRHSSAIQSGRPPEAASRLTVLSRQ